MIFPYGDTPNPEDYIPWGNWLLIGLNVAIYVFISYPLSHQAVNPYDPALYDYLRYLAPRLPDRYALQQIIGRISAYNLYVFTHGFKPGAPELRDLIYSLFLHGGFMHLFGNMLFLWIYGDNVEHRLGHFSYIILYLVCGICASLFFALFNHYSMVPLVGASGAISGVLGFYYLFFPRNRIKVFVFLFPFIMSPFLLPARWVLGFYLLVDNLLPFLFSAGGGGGVAHGAHIGGFLAGLLCAWGYNRLQFRPDFSFSGSGFSSESVYEAEAEAGFATPPETSFQTLVRALDRQQPAIALQALNAIPPQQLMSLDARQITTLADWLRAAGHRRAADHLLRSYIRSHPGSPALAAVYLNLGRARIAEGQAPSAYHFLLEGLEHHPSPTVAEELRRELARVDSYWKR